MMSTSVTITLTNKKRTTSTTDILICPKATCTFNLYCGGIRAPIVSDLLAIIQPPLSGNVHHRAAKLEGQHFIVAV